MDWLDLLAVQGTLKSLLQRHSSNASILWYLAFFIVQLSHPYMTTGKTIALTRWTFVDKVISLLFNMLSRLVIAFLPKSKCLLISWLQSPSAVILEPRKIKSATVSTVYTSICYEVIGPDAMILVFWMLSFKPTHSPSFTFIKSLFSSSSLSPISMVSSAYLRLLAFLPAIFFFLIFIFTIFYFTILYWFCHTLTWIHHGCTCIPKHESPSHLPPHNISLGHHRAPAPSMLYPSSDID